MAANRTPQPLEQRAYARPNNAAAVYCSVTLNGPRAYADCGATFTAFAHFPTMVVGDTCPCCRLVQQLGRDESTWVVQPKTWSLG